MTDWVSVYPRKTPVTVQAPTSSVVHDRDSELGVSGGLVSSHTPPEAQIADERADPSSQTPVRDDSVAPTHSQSITPPSVPDGDRDAEPCVEIVIPYP